MENGRWKRALFDLPAAFSAICQSGTEFIGDRNRLARRVVVHDLDASRVRDDLPSLINYLVNVREAGATDLLQADSDLQHVPVLGRDAVVDLGSGQDHSRGVFR